MDLVLHLPTTFLESEPDYAPPMWSGIEVDGAILDDGPVWASLRDRVERPVLHVHNLIESSISRNLPESPEPARRRLTEHIRRLLEQAAAAEVPAVTLDLGIESGSDEAWQNGLQQHRIEFLAALMPMAEAREIILCIALRIPTSDAQTLINQRGIQLANEIMHPNCQLTLDIFPSELPEDFDLAALVKDYHFKVAVLRLNYEPHLGLRVPPEKLRRWCTALQLQTHRGSLCFDPHLLDRDANIREHTRLQGDLTAFED